MMNRLAFLFTCLCFVTITTSVFSKTLDTQEAERVKTRDVEYISGPQLQRYYIKIYQAASLSATNRVADKWKDVGYNPTVVKDNEVRNRWYVIIYTTDDLYDAKSFINRFKEERRLVSGNWASTLYQDPAFITEEEEEEESPQVQVPSTPQTAESPQTNCSSPTYDNNNVSEHSSGNGMAQPSAGVASSGSYRVTSSTLNVRSLPSKSGTKLFSLSKGDVVNVIEAVSNGWMRIEADGSTGYVYGGYLEPIQPSPSRQASSSRSYSSASSGEATAFWVSLILIIVLIAGFIGLAEDYPYVALLCNLGAAICLAIYATRPADAFWFLDFEKRGFILYCILLILIIVFMSFVLGTLWESLCMIKGLFSVPLIAIIGVAAGLVWLYAVMWLVADFLSEHIMVAILALIGCLPSSRYVGTFIDRDGVKWKVYEDI